MLFAFVVLAGVRISPAAHATAGTCLEDEGWGGGEDYCIEAGEVSAPANPISGGGGPIGIIRLVAFYEDTVHDDPDQECINLEYGWFPDEEAYQQAVAAGEAVPGLTGAYATWPVCTVDSEVDADPATLITAAWEEGLISLPDFAPSTRPAEMAVGLPTYLETGAHPSLEFDHTHPDPLLGWTFTLAATGELWVDWGTDSGWDGPHHTAGEPWPDGTITHAYRDPGDYTITVEIAWTGTWTATRGGVTEQGTLPERTQLRSLDLPVHEVRAVRSR